MKQKLSKKAAAAKRVRDKKYAMTARRRSMKAENQRLRRAYEKKHGKGSLKGKDYDHKRKKFVSVKSNRGNGGKGTKKRVIVRNYMTYRIKPKNQKQ